MSRLVTKTKALLKLPSLHLLRLKPAPTAEITEEQESRWDGILQEWEERAALYANELLSLETRPDWVAVMVRERFGEKPKRRPVGNEEFTRLKLEYELMFQLDDHRNKWLEYEKNKPLVEESRQTLLRYMQEGRIEDWFYNALSLDERYRFMPKNWRSKTDNALQEAALIALREMEAQLKPPVPPPLVAVMWEKEQAERERDGRQLLLLMK